MNNDYRFLTTQCIYEEAMGNELGIRVIDDSDGEVITVYVPIWGTLSLPVHFISEDEQTSKMRIFDAVGKVPEHLKGKVLELCNEFNTDNFYFSANINSDNELCIHYDFAVTNTYECKTFIGALIPRVAIAMHEFLPKYMELRNKGNDPRFVAKETEDLVDDDDILSSYEHDDDTNSEYHKERARRYLEKLKNNLDQIEEESNEDRSFVVDDSLLMIDEDSDDEDSKDGQ